MNILLVVEILDNCMIKFRNKVIMSMIRSSMNNSIILVIRHNIIMILENMIEN